MTVTQHTVTDYTNHIYGIAHILFIYNASDFTYILILNFNGHKQDQAADYHKSPKIISLTSGHNCACLLSSITAVTLLAD